MVNAEFDHQTGILNTCFEGEVFLHEIFDYIVATKENRSYPRFLKILTDATNAQMSFSPEDLNRIVEENKKSLEKYDYIIDAIVVDSPKVAALSVLYQEIAKASNYRFMVFSTRAAAVKWLDSNNPKLFNTN